MFGVGIPELAVIFVVALIVLGPKRLPEVARSLGKALAEFRRVTGEVNRELEQARMMIENEARQHEAARRAAERVAAVEAASAKSAVSPAPGSVATNEAAPGDAPPAKVKEAPASAPGKA